MGAGSNYRPLDRGLAPQTRSPVMQLIHKGNLMAQNIPSTLLLLMSPRLAFFHFQLLLNQIYKWKTQSSDHYTLYISFTGFFTIMPRERGNPRCGLAGYAYVAQRRKRQSMERTLSIAQTQIMRRWIELRTPPRSSVVEAISEPPMACVEEIIPEEPIQVPPEHLLFAVPDNWAPSSDFQAEVSMTATKKSQLCRNEPEQEEFFACFIKEEILGETTSQAAALEDGDTMDDSEGAGRDADMEQHQEEASSKPKEMKQGDTTREDGIVFMPPPISSMQNQWHVPPPFFHPDHLALLFDLRGQMVDQVNHGTLMGQRMDMLYDTFSNVPLG